MVSSSQARTSISAESTEKRWTAPAAQRWYDCQPWLVGSNFIPSTAINQFEMWQAATFDPVTIDRELGWAAGIGMNAARVFLHDRVWADDPDGLIRRIDHFLGMADAHGIRPIFVLFDSCWDPNPQPGPQRTPRPGTHNSGWAQSPGTDGLRDAAQHPRLEAYAKAVVGAFANDARVLAWDVWNEPDNQGGATYAQLAEAEKIELVANLLPQVFDWVRSAGPIQPLTSGLWHNEDWSPDGQLNAVERIQLEQSDIISFHNYDWPESLEMRIAQLRPYGRPLLLTEYMARGNGSTFDSALAVGQRERVAMINWGFVVGKTQTNMPWDSWQRPYIDTQPTLWFHDIFHADGRPYRQAEVDLIRRLTREPKA
ncbi:beta-1,4-xylanase [Asticcacaulis sp. AC460]|uniref:cellulase family glycosylhydrolase n=1 Tax=Asticcacaulis sp. AC460 TaxID=1282360 RepID=UPI0003C3C69A|nr:cellulase family glycosylhydrolase [Asticcacaulis sp. AC460]ESQ90149.1 beta-1,4-xylanase [Asticcacaulis sp. AC460]